MPRFYARVRRARLSYPKNRRQARAKPASPWAMNWLARSAPGSSRLSAWRREIPTKRRGGSPTTRRDGGAAADDRITALVMDMRAVDADWAKSRQYGVTGVPTYACNGYGVVGAQPYEALEKFLTDIGAQPREAG